MNKTARLKIELSEPVQPSIRTMFIGSELTKDQVNAWKKELLEYVSPAPAASGLWWADENFYPIRPVYEGEDTKFKPEQRCTLIDGASGEVIAENVEVAKKTVPITPASLPAVIKHISARAEGFENSDDIWKAIGVDEEVPNVATADVYHETDTSITVRVYCDVPLSPKCYRDPTAYATVECSWRNPLRISSSNDDWRGFGDTEEEGLEEFARFVDHVEDALKEFYSPQPRADGLWWADENFYPIRPLLVGEEPDVRPTEWVTVVDGNTGDVISEAPKRKRPLSKPKATPQYHDQYSRGDVKPWLSKFIDEAMTIDGLKSMTLARALHRNDIRYDVAARIANCFDVYAERVHTHDQEGLIRISKENLDQACCMTNRTRGTWHAFLATGRNEDGSVRYENSEVWVAPDLTITTVDHKPIWTFDPETLQTDRIALATDCESKVSDASFVPCAALDVIDSGVI